MRLKGLAAATAGVLIVAGLGFVSSTASAATTIVPGHVPYPSGGNGAIGVGIDSANQNAQLSDSVPATVAASWHSASPTCPQAAGSGAVSISVSGTHTVVDETAYQCSFVSSYDTTTGAVQWRRSYHFARKAIVSGTSVFVLHDVPADGTYLLDALDLATGAVLWSKPDGQPSDYTLSAGSGIVINNSTALNAATGAPAFTLQTGYTGSSHGVSMVSGGVIYYNDGIRVAAFSAATGARLWKFDKGSSVNSPGSGIAEPSLHNGLLYVNSTAQYAPATTLVLNPSTGALVRTVPRTDLSLAFDGNVGIFVANDSQDAAPTVISAIDLTTGQTYWTHKLSMWEAQPWQVQTAPIVENGLVWLSVAANTGSSAEFVALDEITGAEKSDTVTPCLTSPGNLVVAQHRLFESSDCGVETYVPASGTTPTPPTPGELLTDPGFETSTSGWTADTSGTVSRVSSPTHYGSGALKVTPTSATNPGRVGFAQKTVMTNLTKGSWYRMSCWVTPTGPGIEFQAGSSERTPSGALFQPLGATGASVLPVGVWSYFTVDGTVNVTGDSIMPEFTSPNATTATGGFVIDDCSVTPGYIAPRVTEIDPPSAPQSVSAVPGDGSATISFAPPASNGGAPVTQYVATSTPGGLSAVGAGSPLTVHGLTNGVTYTFVVTATNSAGTGIASAATKPIIPEPAGKTIQFLPDPGFESGTGGWQIFTTGTLTRVTTPVHSGRHAVQVAASGSAPGIVGLTQNTAASATTAGAAYTASCWVRPSAAGLNLTLRFLEYAHDYSSDTHLGVTTVASLPAGVWTQVVVTSKAVASGDRMIPQVYSTNQTTANGTITYDDCSLTTGP